MTISITEFPRFAMQGGDSFGVPSGLPIGSAAGLVAAGTYVIKTSENDAALKIDALAATHTFKVTNVDNTNTSIVTLQSGASMLMQAPKGSTITIVS